MLLLVLDNFEHLLDGADQLSALLAQVSRLKLLVTSREVLNLQEEWFFRSTVCPSQTMVRRIMNR